MSVCQVWRLFLGGGFCSPKIRNGSPWNGVYLQPLEDKNFKVHLNTLHIEKLWALYPPPPLFFSINIFEIQLHLMCICYCCCDMFHVYVNETYSNLFSLAFLQHFCCLIFTRIHIVLKGRVGGVCRKGDLAFRLVVFCQQRTKKLPAGYCMPDVCHLTSNAAFGSIARKTTECLLTAFDSNRT